MREAFRFVRMEIRELALPFRFSFGHALARRRANATIIVTLRANDGQVGYGEVLPRPYLSGESVDSARAALRAWASGLARVELPPPRRSAPGDDPLAPVWEALAPLYEEADRARQTAAYGGLDIAVVDAYARALGLPAARLCPHKHGEEDGGAPPPPAILTAALGFSGPRKTWLAARLARRLGFRDFKIKLGRADDGRRLAAARRALGGLPLRGDANGAWAPADPDPEVARRRRAWLESARLDSVEQPSPAGDGPAALAAARRELGVPVMADESLVTQADARALIAAGAADIWNLRPGKVGGFSGMRALARLARARGIGLHLGVLVGETAVLGTAARACLGLGPFTNVEYGFSPLLLADDPFGPGPAGLRGIGPPPAAGRPGLGVVPRPRALARRTVRCGSFVL